MAALSKNTTAIKDGNGTLISGGAGSSTDGTSTFPAVGVLLGDGATFLGAAANGAAVAGNPVLVAGSDGTNARTLATDALGNLRASGGSLTVSGTALNLNDIAIPSTDVSAFRTVTIQVTSTSGTGNLVGEQSNDNINWKSVITYDAGTNAPPTSVNIGPANGTVIVTGPVTAKFYRVRVNVALGATATVTALFSPLSSAWPTVALNSPGTGGVVGTTNYPDGASLGTGLLVGGVPSCYNGSTGDRKRNNVETSVLASAARTTTINSADQTNYNGRGVKVVLDVSAFGGTGPTLDVKLQAKDSISGNYVDIPGASFAQNTGQVQTKMLDVYPGITPAANAAVSAVVPRTWRVVATIGGAVTPSFTFSASSVTIL